MNINVENAINLFFPNPSLESVYFEAIANAIDANATNIWIDLSITDFNDVSTFELQISDNGDGFTEKNFHKFSNLLEVDEKTHKGIGRLVFLHYFNKVDVLSSYENKTRTFTFTRLFNGKNKLIDNGEERRTTLIFSNYIKSKIREYAYVIPDTIRESILRHFFLRFYKFKSDDRPLEIKISLTTEKPNQEHNFISGDTTLNVKTIPELTEEDCGDTTIDLFEKFKLLYSIKHTYTTSLLITAICADGRTISEDIINKNTLPYGYEMIFILHSNYFSGKSNPSRDSLDIDEDSISKIKRMFRNKVSELITKTLPEIREHNQRIDNELNEKYPHLQGYFEKETIGFIEKDNSIEIAQRKFLKDQKDILNASSLDDIKYEKYLEVSSRLLTEYILYRNLIINKLRQLDYKNNEEEIHNLIAPKRKTFYSAKFMDTIFSNNAWLLDDKYMSYTTILSDKRIKEIYKEIDITSTTAKKDKKPDITIIFSGNPEQTKRIDVVIIELKKLGLELEKKEYMISQLRQRARVLLSCYPDKIQRIWFYGIVDIDPEFRKSLIEDNYIELYSPGSLFYKEQNVIADNDPTDTKIPWGLFIQSYKSFVDDAETRNSTFLKILKESIKKNIVKEQPENISSEVKEKSENAHP
jgi:hypothetical protein